MAELVTIVDTNDPECGCGHSILDHGRMSGCLRATCPCRLMRRDVTADHIERIVRREIAKELAQIVQDEAEDMLSEADYGPDATVYQAVTVASILERAEAIRNG
jgi:hypothetical protein